MNPMLLGGVLEIGRTIIGRLIPDPEKKAAAEMEMVKMAAEGELKQVVGAGVPNWAVTRPKLRSHANTMGVSGSLAIDHAVEITMQDFCFFSQRAWDLANSNMCYLS